MCICCCLTYTLARGLVVNKNLKPEKASKGVCYGVICYKYQNLINLLIIIIVDGVPALVNLLKIDNEEIQSVAASVLCNISEQTEVRLALTKCNAGPILIMLLGSPVDDIQSRSAIILSDLACVEGNQDSIAEENGIAPLVNLLDSELEDVLVNAVNAIRVLCENNYRNKTSVSECHGLEALVEFLTVDSRK